MRYCMIKKALGISTALLALTGCGEDKTSKEHANSAVKESKEAITSASQDGRDSARSMKDSAASKLNSAKEQLKAVPSAISKGAQTAKEEVQNAAPQQDS